MQSARGAQGGYRLTRTPKEYTVGEILRTVEGSPAPLYPCLKFCNTPCDKIDSCITIGLYKKLQDAIDSVVDNTTLEDMIADFHKRHTHHHYCKKSLIALSRNGSFLYFKIMEVLIMITREEAWSLLRNYNKEQFHLRHALTVEGIMRYFCSRARLYR